MEAKDLLQHYDDCVRREKRLKSEILWTRNKLDSLDLQSVWIPKEEKDKVINIEKKLIDWEKKLVEASDTKKKILDLITEIPGLEGEILTRRYVNGEIWEDICESMFYSWSYIHRLHRKAIQMVQERLDQGDIFDS